MPIPPIGVFRQLMRALDQLTTSNCGFNAGAPLEFTRYLQTSWIPYVPDQWEKGVVTGASAPYECSLKPLNGPPYLVDNWYNPASAWSVSGAKNSIIQTYYDWLAAHPGSTDRYLLKKTAEPVWADPDWKCSTPPLESWLAYNSMHATVQPTDHEIYVMKDYCPLPPAYTKSNYAGALLQPPETASDVYGYLKISGASVVPDVWRRCRDDSTVLGGRIQVRISGLEVTRQTLYQRLTFGPPAENLDWHADPTNSFTQTTVTTGADIALLFVARTRKGRLDIIASEILDVSDFSDGVARWIDITNVLRALCDKDVWDGNYHDFFLIPAPVNFVPLVKDPDEAEQLEGLIPWASMTKDVQIDPDTHWPIEFSYSYDGYLVGWNNVEVLNSPIGVKIGASAVSRKMNYFPYPSLVP